MYSFKKIRSRDFLPEFDNSSIMLDESHGEPKLFSLYSAYFFLSQEQTGFYYTSC